MTLWHKFKSSLSRSEKAASVSPLGAAVARPSSPTGEARSLFTWNNRAGGSDRNWKTEAGRLQDNSAVSILLGVVCNNFADAPLCVRRYNKASGAYEVVPEHPLSALLKRPNPHWTRTQLFRAIITSLYLDGNAYVFKARNSLGTPVELWWLPHTAVTVLTDASGFVSGYKYKVKNEETVYDPSDIIHFKLGVNTERPELGDSPLRAVVREVCVDNEVLTYTYSILKNVGVPGVVLSPKIVKTDDGDTLPEITPSFIEKIKASWRRLTTGDERGSALVMTMPWDISVPGFKPDELLLDKVGQSPEVRIAGAFGVPVIVAQFLSGLQYTNAKASYKEAIQQLYGCCLIPLQRLICEWLDLSLLPELGDPEHEHFWFDRSEIAALQEAVSDVWTRANMAFSGGWIKRSEARAMVNLQTPKEEADGYSYEFQLGLGGDVGAATEETPDPTDDGEEGQKAALTIAERWRRAGFPAPEVEALR